jgi:TonB family protein
MHLSLTSSKKSNKYKCLKKEVYMKNLIRVFTLVALLAFLLTACAKQPTQEMDNAKAALETVTKAGADIYAKDELKKLNDDLTAAQNEVNAQSKKLFKKYSGAKEMLATIKTDADALVPVIEARKEISEKYPLSVSFYLGGNKDLLTSIENYATSTYFLYGGSQTQEFSYKLKNEEMCKVSSYFLMLASAGETQFELNFLIKRDKDNILLTKEKFKVASDKYGSYFGFLTPKEIKILEGDIFVFKITGTGSDYGIQHGPDASMVTFIYPNREIAKEILNERTEILDWILKNNKFGDKAAIVYNIYRNIDYLILNNRDGSWDLGSGMTKSGKFYTLEWKNNEFKVDVLSEKQAKEKNIGEYTLNFTRLANNKEKIEIQEEGGKPVAPVDIPPEITKKDLSDLGKKGGVKGGVVGGVVGEIEAPGRAGGRVKAPKLLREVKPLYPEIARQARVEGVVIMEVTIDIHGRVQDVKILRSIPLLDQAAIDAVRQWVYEPTLVNGQPRGAVFTVTVRFSLS